jgi:NADPH:quinone reductase-like Zn-dependent oxidoreductase
MTAATPGAAAAATMTAIAQDQYGSTAEAVLRLAEITRPAIADDEILVQARAASVDRGTWHLMAGLPYPTRPPASVRNRPPYRRRVA